MKTSLASTFGGQCLTRLSALADARDTFVGGRGHNAKGIESMSRPADVPGQPGLSHACRLMSCGQGALA